MEKLFSLEALMSSLSAIESTDPHDTLYAILWLANDAHPSAKNAYTHHVRSEGRHWAVSRSKKASQSMLALPRTRSLSPGWTAMNEPGSDGTESAARIGRGRPATVSDVPSPGLRSSRQCPPVTETFPDFHAPPAMLKIIADPKHPSKSPQVESTNRRTRAEAFASSDDPEEKLVASPTNYRAPKHQRLTAHAVSGAASGNHRLYAHDGTKEPPPTTELPRSYSQES